MDNTYGPLRCRLPRKPVNVLANLSFFRCESCGRALYDFLAAGKSAPQCCGTEMRILLPAPAPENFAYEVAGGFNNNAVFASWTGVSPCWIMLLTFTGAYLKFVIPGKKPPLVFPLSDEDAYAYCGRDHCQKCLYNCKKGCVLYFYMDNGSLYFLPLNQTDKYFCVG